MTATARLEPRRRSAIHLISLGLPVAPPLLLDEVEPVGIAVDDRAPELGDEVVMNRRRRLWCRLAGDRRGRVLDGDDELLTDRRTGDDDVGLACGRRLCDADSRGGAV